MRSKNIQIYSYHLINGLHLFYLLQFSVRQKCGVFRCWIFVYVHQPTTNSVCLPLGAVQVECRVLIGAFLLRQLGLNMWAMKTKY